MRTILRPVALAAGIGAGLALSGWGPAAQDSRASAGSAGPKRSLSPTAPAAPLALVENRGQWDLPAEYALRRGRAALLVRGRGAVLLVHGAAEGERGTASGVRLDLDFGGALAGTAAQGVAPRAGMRHFLHGADPARWVTGARAFDAVEWDAGRGARARVRATGAALELELAFEPRVEASSVELRWSGLLGAEPSGDGGLVLDTAAGRLALRAPRAFAVAADGEVVPLDARPRWERRAADAAPGVGLSVGLAGVPAGRGASTGALLVKTGLDWSTFLGGDGTELCRDAVVSPGGEVTATGDTASLTGLSTLAFPTTPGAFMHHVHGAYVEAYVSRLAADGASLLWSTYLGGSRDDHAHALVLHDSGEVTVVGETGSLDYPTTAGVFAPASQGSFLVGDQESEGFVTRLSADGTALSFSTFLGGDGEDRVLGVALAPSGELVVAGMTSSPQFPASPGAFSTSFSGGKLVYSGASLVASGGDGFVARLSGDGAQLVAATYLGGTRDDWVTDLAVAPSGEVFVCGSTTSPQFPVTHGAFDAVFGGGGGAAGPSLQTDAFVARLSADLRELRASTFLGSSAEDRATALALGPDGAVTVVGTVTAAPPLSPPVAAAKPAAGSRGALDGAVYGLDFPTTAGAFDTSFAGGTLPYSGAEVDGFVARLAPDCRSLVYSTFLGGAAGADLPEDVAVDGAGRALVTGGTGSLDFPTTAGAFDVSFNGGDATFFADAFVAQLSAAGDALVYSTFLGGSLGDAGSAARPRPGGGATVAGNTQSLDLPTSPGSLQPVHGGASHGWQEVDAFAAHVSLLPEGVSRYGHASGGCGDAPSAGAAGAPAAGGSVALTCAGAPALGTGHLVLGARPERAGIPVAGVVAFVDLAAPLVVLPAAADAWGLAQVPVDLGGVPGGQRLYAQFLWPAPGCAGAAPAASDALELALP